MTAFVDTQSGRSSAGHDGSDSGKMSQQTDSDGIADQALFIMLMGYWDSAGITAIRLTHTSRAGAAGAGRQARAPPRRLRVTQSQVQRCRRMLLLLLRT